MIIIGYPGIGKSTLAGRDHRYIDLESSLFMVDGVRALDWYKPYCKVAEGLSRQGYTVFVSSHSAVVEALRASQETVAVIYPSVGLRDEWIAKLKERYLKTLSVKDFRAYSRACWHYADDIMELESCNKVDKICLKTMNYDLQEVLSYYSSTLDVAPGCYGCFEVYG